MSASQGFSWLQIRDRMFDNPQMQPLLETFLKEEDHFFEFYLSFAALNSQQEKNYQKDLPKLQERKTLDEELKCQGYYNQKELNKTIELKDDFVIKAEDEDSVVIIGHKKPGSKEIHFDSSQYLFRDENSNKTFCMFGQKENQKDFERLASSSNKKIKDYENCFYGDINDYVDADEWFGKKK